MKLGTLYLALVLGAIYAIAAEECAVILNQDGQRMPCLTTMGDEVSTVGVDECSKNKHCCVQGEGNKTACYVKAKQSTSSRSLKPDDSLLNSFFSTVANTVNKAKAKKDKAMSRFLSLGPTLGCQPPAPFPANCKVRRGEPYVLDPPTDVPYCFRIPCSIDNNGPLENSHKLCGSQPGCYFDKELFEYREAFGDSVLPGVPVCQLAIRNKVFHEKAHKVVNEYGSWNPYFTNCLLKEYDAEIRAGPKGCELLPMLEVFYIKPKLAGWGTINSRECALIDGCFRPGYGCFYPVDISNVIVKSAQHQIGFSKREIVYGRSKCQHFDQSSPVSILKSYHTCLTSGCAVDSSITALYYNNLFSIGEGLSVPDHWKFWEDAQKGRVGSHNIEDFLGEYDYNPKKSQTILQQPTSQFQIPQLGNIPASNPFSNLFAQLPFKPAFPQAPFFGGASQACGPVFRQYDRRPCAPLPGPAWPRSDYCPYKPFFVPRFPVLKGKFEGCCEINLCYLPKSEISKMHSGPSYYYTEWSLFSSCSATCEAGEKRRYRKCIGHDKSRCTERLVEVRSCQEAPCASWSQWGAFSPCPRTCFPGGIQTKTRTCLPLTGYCQGVGQQVRNCNQQACPVQQKGIWSEWKRDKCVYIRWSSMCKETLKRHCTHMGMPGGRCSGKSTETRRYRCRGCAF